MYIEDPIYFNIDENCSISLPSNIDAVVHLAANTSNADELPSEGEVKAAEILLSATNNIGAKFLFVSSQASEVNSTTGYGKTKWLIEQKVLRNGGSVVRPGLVYGGSLSGLFGSLGRIISCLPLLPQFYPSPKVQPIHVDDLALCLIRILEKENINSQVFSVGQIESISFNIFLRKLSEIRFRSKKISVLIPIFLINIALFLPLIPNSSVWKKKFNSLLRLPYMDIGDDLNILNINLRSLNNGMARSTMPSRRGLLLEAKALMKYILREDPNPALLIRYVRALEALGDVAPLVLPSEFIAFPFLISFINPMNFKNSQMKENFENRLNVCAALAESSLLGSVRFIKRNESGAAHAAVLEIVHAVLCELVCRILGLLISPLIRLRFNQIKDHV
jgi:NADH dehydrogenase